MKYTIERYSTHERFNSQYDRIYAFLLNSADSGINEHFHWGRFEWMMGHSMLDEDKLGSIGIFLDGSGEIVGMVTYDTEIEDGPYLLHSSDDRELLSAMVDYAESEYRGDEGRVLPVANDGDRALCDELLGRGYTETDWRDSVLALDIAGLRSVPLPEGFRLSAEDERADPWKYAVALHRGFDHEGMPDPGDEAFFAPSQNYRDALKVFAIDENGNYCAHCGIWYTGGATAYVEPVVTVPECRGRGLAKAVIYEAAIRAGRLGAKRAAVLSTMEFYRKLGFETSSSFIHFQSPDNRD